MSYISSEVRRMIQKDIQRINALLIDGTDDERFDLHREMDAKYQVLIQNWYVGLQKMSKDPDLMRIKYNKLRENPERAHHNLFMMKYKLEAALLGINTGTPSEVNVSVDSNVQIHVNFEEASKHISELSSISTDQKKEILEKIEEIKSIVQSSEEKSSKWEKTKAVLLWLADKGVDVGLTLLPLLLGIS